MDDYPPSFFARLTDPDLQVTKCRYTLSQMEMSVMADLEELLNTKRPRDGTLFGLVEVEKSVVNFGLRDVSHINGESSEERHKFAEHVRKVIEEFEPRLSNIEVEVRPPEVVKTELPGGAKPGSMYFRIRAKLDVDPVPVEGVIFDTVYHVHTGQHNVSLPGAI
jgi:type VI secretion system protein ImpF